MIFTELFKQYFLIAAGTGSLGIQIPIVAQRCKCPQQKIRLAPTPMVHERDGCSRRFFPQAEMGHFFSFWEIGEEKAANVKVNPPKDKDSGNVMGCFLAKSSSSPNHQERYVFFDMAVMNDRIGWSLWADSYEKKTVSQSPSIGWEYKLFLLQRDKGGAWKVSGGYHWRDRSFTFDNREIHIDLPGKPKWVSRKMEEVSSVGSPTKNTITHYSAMWKQDKTKNQEIFEPIRVWSKDQGKSDIFGSKGNFAKGEEGKGYSQVSDFYHTEWKRWGVHAKGNGNVKALYKVDIGDVLEKWYEPFRGKHGRWIPFGKYCWDRRNRIQEGYIRGCKMTEI